VHSAGGIAAGSIVPVGEPGIENQHCFATGRSNLQMCGSLYISGEESEQQNKNACR
jgi:predicted ATP-dependent serine protease